ncbi:bifunctional diaminohydroxyphosphoribosylaminopyrimidine deaminase/5-amino-6-(5-phosphoribosylamino)uracil reductase RibD [Thermincola ferriacetica]
MIKTDVKYMRMALELAAKARGNTSPNPMVGAVIVKDGRVIGKGYHMKAGTPHAEVHALREAGELSRGATMYVTLEPCSHYGRTPPCSKAVIAAGVARVVVAMEDPNPLVSGQGIQQMREAGIQVEVGLMEKEARELNEVFIKYIKTRRPFVVMKSAMTLDGKIATAMGHSRWITGEEARRLVHLWRSWYDAILVGIGTVLTDNPLLTCRLEDRQAQNPVRIILDSLGRLPVDVNVLKTIEQAPVIVVSTEKIPRERKAVLEKLGAEVLVLPEREGRPDLAALLDELGRREITSLFVEGGATVNASFLKNRLADKTVWFVAPKIVGGPQAPGPVGDMGIQFMDECLNIKNMSVQDIGPDLLITGYPDYGDKEPAAGKRGRCRCLPV